jgi:NAD(P)H-hydrate epimerase
VIPVLTRAQMRAYDRYAIETCHVPGIVLMENAGRGAADVLSAMIGARHDPGERTSRMAEPTTRRAELEARARKQAHEFPTRHVRTPGQPATYPLDARVVVVCGAGNNGGDGFVVARHLMARGADVHVFLAGHSEKVMGEARINHDAFIDLGGHFTELPEGADLGLLELALRQADYAIDGIFGTGLDRPIRGHLALVIGRLNDAPCRVVALDVPSGLDADSGAPLGIAVHADDTVCFGHLKIGLLTPDGARLAGNVHVVDLGVPDRPILAHIGHVAEVLRPETIGSYFVPREASAHKHEVGNVIVIAGSAGKLGAALLAGRAAIRTGAGLVTICTWPDAAQALELRVVEVMTARIDPAKIAASLDAALARRSAVAIGPGLGLDEAARLVVDHVVLGWDGLKVVDADAITHFVGRPEVLAKARGRVILTPHSGELGRLIGKSARAIEQDRFGAVREAVALTRATVVLKGSRTIVATPDGRIYISMAGNPVLATAGSGDVLTGMITALACSLTADRAACAGVFIHALAGDVWRARTGCDRGMVAGDLPELVPELMAALARGDEPKV